jgi:isopentenyl diphosphate isomerase/L-lactate dehydrogenase-like FMN-dependent dehydrogenase
MGLSSFASKPVEDVVAANPQTFFQIYWAGSSDRLLQRLERAHNAGAVGLIVLGHSTVGDLTPDDLVVPPGFARTLGGTAPVRA